ncbi:aspartate--ammonia ligase [Paenibacillus taiwanensis]|uniref:aspartate--ammonia ligase n=1 Tax=Paenibacillus taiwanensis TaxID=401638 RepID=UPI000425C230|nr:aspartate--ammonia ligase [Paenibacillus taiwanensis]
MKALEKSLILLDSYKSTLSDRETIAAINQVKRLFDSLFAEALHVTLVPSPLFVPSYTGINDQLNGTEQPVSFTAPDVGESPMELLHSLAKWKRMALQRLGFEPGEGLYTDMNAIRRDEVVDSLHSIYVDQWDWEKVITVKERNLDFLQDTVQRIYGVLRTIGKEITEAYPQLQLEMPEDIYFVTTQELEDMYPTFTPKQREDAYAKEKGAIFVMQIGGLLKSGLKHDGRSPDYDDWSLNGDIILWNPLLEIAFEVSSMGIRVDAATLKAQLLAAGCPERAELAFHRALLEGQLPYTIGGGIGKSRLCMFLLNKAHIGEVQVSVWPQHVIESCKQANIHLLPV